MEDGQEKNMIDLLMVYKNMEKTGKKLNSISELEQELKLDLMHRSTSTELTKKAQD